MSGVVIISSGFLYNLAKSIINFFKSNPSIISLNCSKLLESTNNLSNLFKRSIFSLFISFRLVVRMVNTSESIPVILVPS